MISILDAQQYFNHLKNTPKEGEKNILSFYNHHVKAICRNPRLCLVPLDDHMVHRGDGVFEALTHENGCFYLIEEHLDRLKRSANRIGIKLPCSLEEIKNIIAYVALAGEAKKSSIRIFVGRGVGSFGVNPNDCPEASLYVVCTVYKGYPQAFFQNGVKGLISSYKAKDDYMATTKSLNYLPNVLMKKEALVKGAVVPLVLDENGILTEGVTENIVIVTHEDIIKVPSFRQALKGTTVNRLVQLWREKGIKVETDCDINQEQIFTAKEVIALGTTTLSLSLIQINDTIIHDGKVGNIAKMSYQMLLDDMQENSTRIPLEK